MEQDIAGDVAGILAPDAAEQRPPGRLPAQRIVAARRRGAGGADEDLDRHGIASAAVLAVDHDDVFVAQNVNGIGSGIAAGCGIDLVRVVPDLDFGFDDPAFLAAAQDDRHRDGIGVHVAGQPEGHLAEFVFRPREGIDVLDAVKEDAAAPAFQGAGLAAGRQEALLSGELDLEIDGFMIGRDVTLAGELHLHGLQSRVRLCAFPGDHRRRLRRGLGRRLDRRGGGGFNGGLGFVCGSEHGSRLSVRLVQPEEAKPRQNDQQGGDPNCTMFHVFDLFLCMV